MATTVTIKQPERHANLVKPVIEAADKAGKGITYTGIMEKTGLEYHQVQKAVHFIINHRILINDKPIGHFRSGRTIYWHAADDHAEAMPIIQHRRRYAMTMVNGLMEYINTVIAVHGKTKDFHRISLDMRRVQEDFELMTMP